MKNSSKKIILLFCLLSINIQAELKRPSTAFASASALMFSMGTLFLAVENMDSREVCPVDFIPAVGMRDLTFVPFAAGSMFALLAGVFHCVENCVEDGITTKRASPIPALRHTSRESCSGDRKKISLQIQELSKKAKKQQ